MITYLHLARFPKVFVSMTGLRIDEFDSLVDEVSPLYAAAEQKRLSRRDRQRRIGGGHPFELSLVDRMLLTVIWLRRYPTQEVLGYLFGVSDSSALRYVAAILPLLEQSGRDTMRMPDPGKHQRRSLDALLSDTPALAVVIDTFEQRIQRPSDHDVADTYYSGKKKQHTLKSQIAVNEVTGEIVEVAESVRGPTADIKVLEASELMSRLPKGVGGIGDLAYIGIDKLNPDRQGAAPRRKPRGQPRPADDVAYNTAFSRRRIVVEHTIRRVRCYESLTHSDRHHRCGHTTRVRAVAGLVNRQIGQRMAH